MFPSKTPVLPFVRRPWSFRLPALLGRLRLRVRGLCWKTNGCMPLLLSLTVLLWGLMNPAVAETLRAGGVGAVTMLLPSLYSEFDRDGANKLEVIPGLGSSGGLRALAEGALDFAVSGRPLNADELKEGLRVVAAVRTPFVLVTSHANPNSLKSTEIADIFKTPKAMWADGSVTRVILRPKSDSDTTVLGVMFPGMVSAIEAARARQDTTIAATDQDNADAAERIKGSLTGTTLTQMITEQRNLRVVAIDGLMPGVEAMEAGAYPFTKTISFVLPAKRNTLAERFIAFIQSPAGQEILRAKGSSPKTNLGGP
jgi:phosphate transport system substrate-binding protein